MKLLYGQHPYLQQQIENSTDKLSEINFQGGVYKWWCSDSKNNFDNLSKTLPAKHPWHKWKNIDLKYTVNDQLYRAPNWDKINWEGSILLFGCSQTFGQGLDDSQTLSYHLENLIEKPVINLASSGTSNMFQWINTTILRTYGIRPKAVIYLWTFAGRTTLIAKDNLVINSGLWNFKTEPLAMGWNSNKDHSLEYSKYAILSSQQQWKEVGCPVLNYTIDDSISKNMDTVTFLDAGGDLARDMAHVGPTIVKKWAETICEKLKPML